MSTRGADNFDRIEDLPDDNTREKEVYARFGLAMFHAQVFEGGMTMMIVALITVGSEPVSSRGGQEKFTELLEDLYSHTAGRLLRKLRTAGWVC